MREKKNETEEKADRMRPKRITRRERTRKQNGQRQINEEVQTRATTIQGDQRNLPTKKYKHTHRTEMKETDTRTVMDKKETDTGREKEKARAKDESI